MYLRMLQRPGHGQASVPAPDSPVAVTVVYPRAELTPIIGTTPPLLVIRFLTQPTAMIQVRIGTGTTTRCCSDGMDAHLLKMNIGSECIF
jgi:hypothetical protein